MITRSIDSDGDWIFGNGKSDYLDENAALAQNIKTRLLSFKNDCFFDLDAGIDWFAYLGSKNINGLRLAISAIILNTTGVTDLKQLTLELENNRALLIQYSVDSAWSTTVSSSVTLG